MRVVASSRMAGVVRVLRRRCDGRAGGVVARRSFSTRSTPSRRIALGRLAPGRYRITIQVTDAAGNTRTVRRSLPVR